MREEKRGRSCRGPRRRGIGATFAAIPALLAAVACCADGGAESAEGRLGFALTLPAAEVGEVDSIGMFALDLDPASFDCGSYLAGDEDPISSTPEAVVAAGLEFVEPLADGSTLVFSDVPVGRWVILVECYDAGGTRLFIGCGDVRVEASATSEIELQMQEDPLIAAQSAE